MSKKESLAKGGVLGVLVGAIAGLLLAPKSGKETRKDIKDAAIKANKEAEKKLKELHTELNGVSKTAVAKAETLKGKAQAELSELGKRADFTKDKVGELISSVREFEADEDDIDQAMDEGKKVIKEIVAKTKPAAKKAVKKATPSKTSKKA